LRLTVIMKFCTKARIADSKGYNKDKSTETGMRSWYL
jgi:hypothetical protein